MAPSELTPMMRQYAELKAEHDDVILFFQLGDFYETFYEDAELCARELEVALTQREGAPMAGVPIKKAHRYLNRLLKRGHKVALCDQVQDPSEAKGPVEREVVRVVTPGTVLDEEALEGGKPNHIVALFSESNGIGLAAADVSTGSFSATELTASEAVRQELARLQPTELVLPEGLDGDDWLPRPETQHARTLMEPHRFREEMIREHFGLATLEGLGLTALAGRAAGGLLDYLRETQKAGLHHLQPPTAYTMSGYVGLDAFTQRNLELVRELRTGGERHTLLATLDATATRMGERLLRRWVLTPLLDRSRIERRLAMVERLAEAELARSQLRERLDGIHDVERLAGKVGAGRATPRDLLSLAQSLAHLPSLRQDLARLQDPDGQNASSAEGPERLARMRATLDELALDELAEALTQALREDAPTTSTEGGILQEGYDPDLDDLKAQERDHKNQILELERSEQQTTGIPSLKIGYNSVFGYYIEVTQAHTEKVPDRYTRKQTLKAAERYVTSELKSHEEAILAAQERAREREHELFLALRTAAAEHLRELQTLAELVAELDVYASLAEVAKRRGYTRPRFSSDRTFEIVEGRHPVVETLQEQDPFVPNDCRLSPDETLAVLTGPNMSGKSTFLRQNALICLMAQIGSFVPAKRATLPIVDQIFTRVGATDMLAFGYSTFMVEMIEAAQILNRATEQSLVILDEIGRGTSTFDGVAIAWAVAEHLVSAIRAQTLFATHYHELTRLADHVDGVVNLHVRAEEHGEEIVFLHRVERGEAEGSYGIHVAKLAGLPDGVVRRASEVLERILRGNPLDAIDGDTRRPRPPTVIEQPALFEPEPHPVLEELSRLDVECLTPIEALNRLHELKSQLNGDE